jgi:Lrp/AsnC family transcriptional regulator, regulator for asnA, asnC and gidA
MTNTVKIDEIDDKILHILIKDARTSLTEIAKQCGLSSVSVLNRIKRLKKLGVITGATLLPSLNMLGFTIVATIGIQTEADTDEILKMLDCYTTLIEPATSVGEYDLCALVYAESLSSLNEKLEAIRRRFSIKKLTVNVWSGIPHINFENVELNTFGEHQIGRTRLPDS